VQTDADVKLYKNGRMLVLNTLV